MISDNDNNNVNEHFENEQIEDRIENNLVTRPDVTNLSPSLSVPLRILFGINGVTLSLSWIPIMFIVNTRVKMPLSYLPSYGAVSFLPNSLKPIYAVVSYRFPRRDYLLSILLIICGASYLSAIFVGTSSDDGSDGRKVLWTFAMGFTQGVGASFPEFLLGLTLLDEATMADQSKMTTTATVNDTNTKKSAAAIFQSQAATARNLGSLCASIFSALLLYLTNQDHGDLSNSVVTTMLMITGGLNFLASLFAWWFSIGLQPGYRKSQQGALLMEQSTLLDDSSNAMAENSCCYDDETPITRLHNVSLSKYESVQQATVQSEENGARHEHHQDKERNSDNLPNYQTISSSNSFQDNAERQERKQSTKSCANITLIILLQLVVIIFAMRGPLSSVITARTWTILAYSVVGCLVLNFIYWLLFIWQPKNSNQNSWWVGAFLILRNIVPSPGYLVGSFFYSLLEKKLAFLQFISILDTAAVTLGSWTFGKVFSSWSVQVVVFTTLLAVSFSLIYGKGIQYILGHHISVNEDDDRDNTDSANEESSWIAEDDFVWFTIVYVSFKIFDAFAGEWKFLPDVILATESATYSEKLETESYVELTQSGGAQLLEESAIRVSRTDITTGTIEEQPSSSYSDSVGISGNGSNSNNICVKNQNSVLYENNNSTIEPPNNTNCSNNNETRTLNEKPPSLNHQSTGIKYGMLISCINFGDQIGALLAGPLVTTLGISRETEWANLDVLIELCALFEMIPIAVLIVAVLMAKYCPAFTSSDINRI